MTSASSKINFGAGPAALPQEVLQQASEAVIEYGNSGLSVLEIAHRGRDFTAILEESKSLVRELCGLNNDYEVIWLQGGGRLQFCMVPMNFLLKGTTAGYIDSGTWSSDAISYASLYGDVRVLASSKEYNYTRLPEWPAEIPQSLSYLHITTNNTIYGTQWPEEIPFADVSLIADMSSDILCRKRDYTRYAMFYAAAQKNLGAAGNTLVVIHKEQLKKINTGLPPMLDYAAHVSKNSVLNTPPVYAIYVSLLMLRWTKAKGIETIETENLQKAELLYNEIGRNSLFTANVTSESRSIMNVCFTAVNEAYAEPFISFCEQEGITGIKGHRSTGGFRVSLYNAIPLAAVEKLVSAMRDFEQHQKL